MNIMMSTSTLHPNAASQGHSAWVKARKATIVATLLAMQCHWMAPAMAMHQLPLLSTPTSSVLPNFVLTMDNSESMALHHLPESSVKVNGVNVILPGTKIVLLHPSAPPDYSSHDFLKNAVGTVTSGTGETCMTAFECQMRSSAVNSIYYNPAVLYQPWRSSTKPTERMPAASFKGAYFNPLDAAKGAADLSSTSNGLAGTWCTKVENGNPVCETASPPFNPAVFYMLKSDTADPNSTSSYTKYDLNANITEMGWGKSFYPERTDCSNSCTMAQERQNFANWFTYYRSRILLAKGAISEAMVSVGSNTRVGWGFTSNARKYNSAYPGQDAKTGLGWPTQGVKEFDNDHQKAFLAAIQAQELNGSTPLRFATAGVGSYFKKADAWSPWRTLPGQGETAATKDMGPSTILGCRRGAHILITDGYYNDGPGDLAGDFTTSGLAVGEVDNVSKTENGVKYTPTAPYADGLNSNSLADIAMQYWAFPLLATNQLSNAAEKVEHTPTDKADWLHLNQYMIGLGVKGSLDAFANWPPPASVDWKPIPNAPQNNSDPSKIDDMKHAAWNSRGAYFTANTSSALTKAISESMQPPDNAFRTEAGVATVGMTAEIDNIVFTPQYNAKDWSGDIFASKINNSNGPTLQTSLLWRASDGVPAPAARNIFAYSTRDGNVAAFTELNVAHFDTIDSKHQIGSFINFIRGVNAPDTTYRQRTGKLPDFINSTPLVVGSNLDLKYDETGLPSGGAQYRAFVQNKSYRKPLLFIGGNGGMLHAFNASQLTDPDGGGSEIFAYIPKGVQPNLHQLAQSNYSHRFYVDGPLTETDAYLSTSTATGDETKTWRNIVIGTLGAGGKGVFAIEVPMAGNASAQESPPLGATNVKWDISDKDVPKLGYVTSAVESGYVQGDGGWYAFIGNGHESAGENAALIVVNLQNGSVARVFDLPKSGDTSAPNGLSGVSLIRNAKQEVIGAYAGDLHGQIWRFEFEGSDVSKWKVGFGGTPLFTARRGTAVQKITAAPVHYQLQPSTGTGNLVLFGTGRLTESSDTTDTSVQSFYGVLDPTDGTQSSTSSPFAASTNDRDLLQPQEILPKITGQTLLRLSNHPVPLKGAGQRFGWYIDLTFSDANTPGLSTGESHAPKVIYKPTIVRKLVFFTAVSPPTARETCTPEVGSQFTLLVPVLRGGQSAVQTWDTDGNGVINGSDELGQGFLSRRITGESKVRDTQSADIGVDVDPQNLKRFNKCAGDDSFDCRATPGGLKPIADRVWKRIVKPPF